MVTEASVQPTAVQSSAEGTRWAAGSEGDELDMKG